MKRIGIVTLFGYENYGNRLQMYAVQQVYKNLGFESEIIKYKLKTSKDPFNIRIKVVTHYLLFLGSNISVSFLKAHRIFKFRKHAQIHYSESRDYINPLAIKNTYHERYSFFSVGSDQIWGWFANPIADFIFLKFAPKNKRMTFSPSFGSSTLDEKYIKKIKEGLEGFERISVRELSGAQIVQALTDKEATVLCDPTMCLSKLEWLQFAKVHNRKPKQKYILTYFLGEQSPKVVDVLKNLSAEFEIVNLNSFQSPQYYAISPSEWVDYINDAELFLTDSFHGVAFSIVMQTPFAVYTRVGGESMQTRIIHILEKFKMEDRFEKDFDDASLFKMDYACTVEKIESEKVKAYDFLKKSININL